MDPASPYLLLRNFLIALLIGALVGARLTAMRFDRILASPLQRARRTAELAMPRSWVEADDDLMEWDYGAYEGRRTVDIEEERPGWRLFRDGCPGGESLSPVTESGGEAMYSSTPYARSASLILNLTVW